MTWPVPATSRLFLQLYLPFITGRSSVAAHPSVMLSGPCSWSTASKVGRNNSAQGHADALGGFTVHHGFWNAPLHTDHHCHWSGSGDWLDSIYLSRALCSDGPPDQTAELFGFHALVSKVSAVGGPLMFGLISSTTGNQRLAMMSVLVFILAGGWVLFQIPSLASASNQLETNN
jgi:hypothetical protein